jgi:carboxymethylenebutenolidase
MLVGDDDPTIPAEHVEAIKSAAAQEGTDLRVVVFAGAGHAFHCDARPAQYDAGSAVAAWRETTDFLSKNLPAGSQAS